MKNPLSLLVTLFLVSSTLFSQTSDKEGIIKASTDYVDGAYDADGNRVKNAVHPEMNKAIVEYIPSIERSYLRRSRPSQLVAVVNAKAAFIPEDQRSIEVKVLDIDGSISMAMITSNKFIDYCQLVKNGEDWKIVNVLWTYNPENRPPNFKAEEGSLTEELARGAAMDYIDGAYSGNAERMERALHPELNKVFPYQIPNSPDQFLAISGYEGLIEMTRAQVMVLPEDQRKIDCKVLSISENIAAVKVTSAKYIDYCHIGLVNGEAKIINVLWRPNQ